MTKRILVNLRHLRRGGAVRPAEVLLADPRPGDDPHAPVSADALLTLRALRGPVVALVHGFNVDRNAGIAGLRGAMALVERRFEAELLLAVLWPGDSWLGPVGYPSEADDADDSGVELAKFIGTWLKQRPVLHMVTHSLGARVAMSAVRRLLRESPPWPIGRLCLMAPAVDRDCLVDVDPVRGYAGITQVAERIGVLSSKQDWVLWGAYPAGDLGMWLGFGDTDRPGLALGYSGPLDAAGIDPLLRARIEHWPIADHHKVGHGDYLPDGVPPVLPNRNEAAACRAAADFLAGRPLEFRPE